MIKRGTKIGSKHVQQSDQNNIESEGEVGDAKMYADRANGLALKTQA